MLEKFTVYEIVFRRGKCTCTSFAPNVLLSGDHRPGKVD